MIKKSTLETLTISILCRKDNRPHPSDSQDQYSNMLYLYTRSAMEYGKILSVILKNIIWSVNMYSKLLIGTEISNFEGSTQQHIIVYVYVYV